MICVCCGERPADFDPYLCQTCAVDMLGVDRQGVREAYSFFVRSGRAVLEASERAKSKNLPNYIYFEVPSASLAGSRRLHYFYRILEMVREVEGNIVECGVGSGQSLFYWCSLAFDLPQFYGVWGFDTFEGLPPSTVEDVRSNMTVMMPFPEEERTTLERVMNGLVLYGIPLDWIGSHLTLVRGLFQNTLHVYSKQPIAVLHVDANLYESYKTALDTLYPRVAEGGAILFDEYASTHDLVQFPGAKKAIDQFLREHELELMRDKQYGKHFTIKNTPRKST